MAYGDKHLRVKRCQSGLTRPSANYGRRWQAGIPYKRKLIAALEVFQFMQCCDASMSCVGAGFRDIQCSCTDTKPIIPKIRL